MGVGTSEVVLILAIVLLVFGSSRLPTLGKAMGEGLRDFRDALRGASPADESGGAATREQLRDSNQSSTGGG